MPLNKNADNVSAPAKRTVELLDSAPAAIRRPLTLIGGCAYAAIWPHVKVTLTETTDENGKTVRHNPPRVKVQRQLCIVRSDNVMFDDGEHALSDLMLDVVLPAIPPDSKLWSSLSARAFCRGERANPREVFSQIVDVIDRFIDFDRSLADQRTMGEMVACYTLATWFLDAFNVIGFLWPNGERGSGKTQLLNLIAELGYLGQMILAGSSYATLRDLADYGATLCFDDAENFALARRTDPDKRALLLAGNRRGAVVTVKEPSTDGKAWQTRYVNAFCPRAFSAINLPDEILASRTIIVPLIRTGDRRRANADPMDYKLWPHDRQGLVDSLWSLAVAHLPQLSEYESRVNESAGLSGRDLEPWRPVLAVASWLEDAGVSGLYGRMERLSMRYQSDRQQLESCDLASLVIRALCKCLNCDVVTLSDHCDVAEGDWHQKVFVLTADIESAARSIAEAEDLDIDTVFDIDRKTVGRTMRKLRFEHANEGGTHRKGWKVSRAEVARFVKSFGLEQAKEHTGSDTASPLLNVTTVTDGHIVTNSENRPAAVA